MNDKIINELHRLMSPNVRLQLTSVFEQKQKLGHFRKPRVLTPLRSLRVRNEVELVPLACED